MSALPNRQLTSMQIARPDRPHTEPLLYGEVFARRTPSTLL